MATPPTRVPPHSAEAEAALLGAILLDNAAIDAATELIAADGEDFYRAAHQKLWKCATDLHNRGEPVDALTLVDALRSRSQLEAVGGAPYVAELAERAVSAANATSYARILRDKAQLRRLIRVNGEIAEEAYQGQEDVDLFVDRAEQKIFDVSERKASRGFVPVADVVTDALRKVEELYQRKDAVTGVPTGFIDLDRMTAGLQPSDLVIVAGRPSMGKTSFVLNIAEHVAIDLPEEERRGVGFFSLEMSQEQLVMRLLCSQARIDLGKLRSGRLSSDDFTPLATATGMIHDAPIYIDDTPAITVSELRAKARRLKKNPEARLGLVIVDYLQLMRGRGESREQEISDISRSLKALAKEISVPVIALSQLNRQVENRQPPKPRMADLRESGAIEQDADVIAFIYREEAYDPDTPRKGEAEIIVAKQRNGPIGEVRLTFLSGITRFENFSGELAEDDYEELL